MWETTLGVLTFLLPLIPGGLWCAWWLWGVNWKQVWPVLAEGGWVGVVLLTVASALAWSQVFPTRNPAVNFWWQLLLCAALALVALFCGWLQDQLGWTPAEVSFDPPEEHNGHGHGHAHGHGHH
jgi:hypothetical protein